MLSFVHSSVSVQLWDKEINKMNFFSVIINREIAFCFSSSDSSFFRLTLTEIYSALLLRQLSVFVSAELDFL